MTIQNSLLSLAPLCFLILTSCTGVHDAMSHAAGLGVVRESQSTFDNSKSVTMSPAPLYGQKFGGNNVSLGATWVAKHPSQVGLILLHNGSTSYSTTYLGIRGLDINIDGKISSYSVTGLTDFDSGRYNSISKSIYTKSHNSVIIPLSVLKRMMTANDCRLRIRTSKGYEERIFSKESNGGAKMAKAHMRKFMAKINSTNR